MANFGSLEELWRHSLDLNIRYYSAVGRLTTDYLKDLVAVLTDLRASPPQIQLQPQAQTAGVGRAPDPPPTVSGSLTAPAAAAQQAGVMVLEGEAGSPALGVFLVVNHLGHEVSARVTASAFSDADGRSVQPSFIFDPDLIVLAPAEQVLVRVMLLIEDSLEPDVRYRGEFTIPELAGTHIPIVLRRRLAEDKSSLATIATDQPTKTRSPQRRGAARAKRVPSGGPKSQETKS